MGQRGLGPDQLVIPLTPPTALEARARETQRSTRKKPEPGEPPYLPRPHFPTTRAHDHALTRTAVRTLHSDARARYPHRVVRWTVLLSVQYPRQTC